jgi:HAD superfamily hydrolase (TIGR01509 family)
MASVVDPSGVRFVCFDLGNVLVRLVKDWGDACTRAGVSLPHSNADGWRRQHDLMIRYETGDLDKAAYLQHVPACIPGVTHDTISRVFDAWLLGLYPGVRELIDELQGAGFITGCLSNTNEHHWGMIIERPEYDAIRDLDHLFASHHIRAMKPAESAYRHVERETGFKGGQILFFDDKPENVDAARAVGWRAEQIDRLDDAVGQMREMLVKHTVL